MSKRWIDLTLVVMGICMVACSMAPLLGKDVSTAGLKDGIYEGSYSSFPNSAIVRVTIEDNKLKSVELLKHIASSRGTPAAEIIPPRIVAEQSTRVDAVSGATNSSRVIMNAVQDAMVKAQTGGGD